MEYLSSTWARGKKSWRHVLKIERIKPWPHAFEILQSGAWGVGGMETGLSLGIA